MSVNMTVVKPKPEPLKAPAGLSKAAKAFYLEIAGGWDLDEDQKLLLQTACEALDDYRQARAVLRKEGFTELDRFGQGRPKPEVAIARDCRAAFGKLLRMLNLEDDSEDRPPGRPPESEKL